MSKIPLIILFIGVYLSISYAYVYFPWRNQPDSVLAAGKSYASFLANRMNSVPNRHMMPVWPPIAQEELENPEFAPALGKRTILDPRQIRSDEVINEGPDDAHKMNRREENYQMNHFARMY